MRNRGVQVHWCVRIQFVVNTCGHAVIGRRSSLKRRRRFTNRRQNSANSAPFPAENRPRLPLAATAGTKVGSRCARGSAKGLASMCESHRRLAPSCQACIWWNSHILFMFCRRRQIPPTVWAVTRWRWRHVASQSANWCIIVHQLGLSIHSYAYVWISLNALLFPISDTQGNFVKSLTLTKCDGHQKKHNKHYYVAECWQRAVTFELLLRRIIGAVTRSPHTAWRRDGRHEHEHRTCLWHWQVSLSRRRHRPTPAGLQSSCLYDAPLMTSLWCRRQQVSAAARSKASRARVPCNLLCADRRQLLTWSRPPGDIFQLSWGEGRGSRLMRDGNRVRRASCNDRWLMTPFTI